MTGKDDRAPGFRFLAPSGAPRVVAGRAADALSASGGTWALDLVAAWRVLAFAEYDVSRTLLSGVESVPFGNRIVEGPGGVLSSEPPRLAPDPDRDPDSAARRVRAAVLDGVRGAIEGARRVAVLLSGGLDSGCVAAALAAAWKESGRDPADLGAFTVVPPPAEGEGEGPRARALAAHVGIPFRTLEVRRPADPFAGCDDMLRRNDLPSDDGRFALGRDRYAAIREAGFDLVLTGNGGDEVFGGGSVEPWRRPTGRGTAVARAEHGVRGVARAVRARIEGRARALGRKARAMRTPARLLGRAPAEPHAATYAPTPSGLPADQAERWSRAYSARQMVLASYGRAWGDALGISIRSPLLSLPVVRLATSLSPALHRSNEVDRPLLRRAFAADLPSLTASAPKSTPSGVEFLSEAIRARGRDWFEAHVAGTAIERSGLAPRDEWDEILERGANGSPEETFRALAYTSLGAWCRARGLHEARP